MACSWPRLVQWSCANSHGVPCMVLIILLSSWCVLQTKAWLGWEHSVSSSRSNSLQWWNGQAWQQSPFPSHSLQQAPPPHASATGRQDPQSGATAAASNPAPSSSSAATSSSAAATHASSAAPAMSAFAAQALLECHYSKHHAFLEEQPLLQVRCVWCHSVNTCKTKLHVTQRVRTTTAAGCACKRH